MKTKKCSKCKHGKFISEFCKNKNTKDGFQYWCKSCMRKEMHKNGPSRKKTYYAKKGHKTSRFRLYGITPEQYDMMYQKQAGCCAICGIHQSELKKALGVDHNHTTKQVRGLLCFKCNLGIGYFSDKIIFVSHALSYLKEYEEK